MGNQALADNIPLSDEDVHWIAREELRNVSEDYSDELRTNWEKSYKYYRVDPRGDERPGRSKIQSSDVSDAIEWILPVIVKAFVESPDVVRFDAVTPNDEQQADLESDFCHYLFMKQSNGFLILYEFIKDMLLLKNGISFTYWCNEVKQKVELFSDLTEKELNLFLNPVDGSDIRLESIEETEKPVNDPQTREPLLDENGNPVTVTYYSGKARVFTTHGKPDVEVCVPEKFRLRRDHYSIDLQKCRFAVYSMIKSCAEMVSAGYDPEVLDTVPGVEQTRTQWDEVRRARQDVENYDEHLISPHAVEKADLSQRLITVNRCFMPLDVNGDGFEEYYLVTLGGDDGEVLLDYYEVDTNPFDSASPFVAAHKFWGYSFYDKLREIQDLKTKMIRMISDNIDLINDPEKVVIPGMMRLEDAMVKRVGGLKRVDDPSAYQEIPPSQVGPHAFQILEWADKTRSERVGVDPDAASISKIFPDEAMNTALERLMTAKEEVISLIIRVTAELWFKHVMLKIRKLAMTHLRREQIVELRGKWTRVDPRNWFERHATTVKVGLGTGDRLKKMMGLEKVIAMQAQEMQLGGEGVTVTPSKRVSAYGDFVQAAGLGDTDSYFLNPMKTEMEVSLMQSPRDAPNPEAYEAFLARQKKQAEMEAAAASAQQGVAGPDPQTLLQLEQMKGQTTIQVKQMELQAQTQENQTKAFLEQQSQQLDAALERVKLMEERQRFYMEEQRKWAELFEKFDIDAAQVQVKAEEARTRASTSSQGSNGGGD